MEPSSVSASTARLRYALYFALAVSLGYSSSSLRPLDPDHLAAATSSTRAPLFQGDLKIVVPTPLCAVPIRATKQRSGHTP
jgi:hypothetical protein